MGRGGPKKKQQARAERAAAAAAAATASVAAAAATGAGGAGAGAGAAATAGAAAAATLAPAGVSAVVASARPPPDFDVMRGDGVMAPRDGSWLWVSNSRHKPLIDKLKEDGHTRHVGVVCTCCGRTTLKKDFTFGSVTPMCAVCKLPTHVGFVFCPSKLAFFCNKCHTNGRVECTRYPCVVCREGTVCIFYKAVL